MASTRRWRRCGLLRLSTARRSRTSAIRRSRRITIRLHRLVREVAAARREGEAREEARRALIEAMAAVYPGGWFRQSGPLAARRGGWTRLALALAGGDADAATGGGGAGGRSAEFGSSISYTATALLRRLYAQARPLYERALAIDEKALGPEHPDTAAASTTSPFCFSTRATSPARGRSMSAPWRSARRRSAPSIPSDGGEPQQPRPYCFTTRATLPGRGRYYERALAIREKALGPEHPDTATSLNNLACLLLAQGDLADARPLMNARWRSGRRCSAPSIPIRRAASTTSRSCLRPRATLRGRGHSMSARWRSARKCSAPSIPTRREVVRREQLGRLLLATGTPVEALHLAEAALSRRMQNGSGETIHGPRTRPPSPPMRSTCSAVLARPRRCARVMVSKEILARRRDIPCQASKGRSAL